jgi:hypothetical protein
MLPVVYEKYNYLLFMNINAEIYKFSFTENKFLIGSTTLRIPTTPRVKLLDAVFNITRNTFILTSINKLAPNINPSKYDHYHDVSSIIKSDLTIININLQHKSYIKNDFGHSLC